MGSVKDEKLLDYLGDCYFLHYIFVNVENVYFHNYSIETNVICVSSNTFLSSAWIFGPRG